MPSRDAAHDSKHKGTEHFRADIKSRMKELSEDLGGPRKGGARGGPELAIRPEGAAQVALLGPPNAGKSTLHARLTGSHAVAGPYPFATKFPQPGMLPHEDVHFTGRGRARGTPRARRRGPRTCLAGELRFARVWGRSADFEGQQVSGDHVVQDRDVVELHW